MLFSVFFMHLDGGGTVLQSGGMYKRAEGFLLMYNSEERHLDIRVKDADTYYFSTPSISPNYWLHLVFNWERGSDIRAYINGCPENISFNRTRSLGLIENYPLTIGSEQRRIKDTVDMVLDELKVWYSVLSIDQVRQLYLYGNWSLCFAWHW